MKKKLIFKIILVCSFCVMLFSIFNIVLWYVDSENTKTNIKKVQKLAKVEVVKDSNFFSIDFDELINLDNEIVAWIQVPDTNINFPVVKHSDNNYYLSHSYDKSWNNSGWIFLDYRNDINDLVSNTIIYGHGRTDGTMFGSLRNFFDLDAGKHIINISTPYNNYIFEIFSVYLINKTNDYLSTGFDSNDDFLNFIDIVKKRSIKDYDVSVLASDKLLTLTTCHNSWQKLVVHAKLISWEKRF